MTNGGCRCLMAFKCESRTKNRKQVGQVHFIQHHYEDFSGLRPRTRKQVLNLHDDDNCNKNWRSSLRFQSCMAKIT